MKKKLFTALAAALALSLSCAVPASAAFADFTDVDGHWAKDTLSQAFQDGIMTGNGPTTMSPNKSVTTAQAVTILCRVLNVTGQEPVNVPQGAWYAEYAAKGVYAGLLDREALDTLEEPITRGEAFLLFGRAFQVTEAAPDLTKLNQFSDAALLTGERQRAAASLVNAGIVSGVDGKLQLDRSLTRAEFATILYRLADCYTKAAGYSGQGQVGAVLSGDANLNGVRAGKLLFDQTASNISLNNVSADLVVVRSSALSSLSLDGSGKIGRLVLAASGDAALDPPDYCQVETLVVGEGSGTVSMGADTSRVEVTGDQRTVELAGSTGTLVVSGSGNTIHLDKGCSAETILITGRENTLKLDGTAETLRLAGPENTVNGSGRVTSVDLNTQKYTLTVSKGSVEEWKDFDLEGVEMSISGPGNLAAGESLKARVNVTVPEQHFGKLCTLSWYLNDTCMQEQSFLLGGETPVSDFTPDYIHDMLQEGIVKAVLTYENSDGDKFTKESSYPLYLETFSDLGLADSVVTVSVPETLAPGETLNAVASIQTPENGKKCTGHWYIDGTEVYSGDYTLGSGDTKLYHKFEYYYGMPANSTVSYALTYTTEDGREQEVSGSAKLAVENYADNGIARSSISLSAPKTLEAGKALEVTANIKYLEAGKACVGEWYVDGTKVSTQNIILGQDTPKLSHKYTYTENMKTDSAVRFVLNYTTQDGRAQKTEASTNLTLQNYGYLHYHNLTEADVLKTVTSGYAGNYTLAWAQNNDYRPEIKTAWVNLKGYSSNTNYLIWVNLTYQRVNVFTGSQGNWKLVRSCLCGSGKAGTATPRGVYTTSYKQSSWNYGSYYCGPIVRFNGSSGLAFHSRLEYWPMNSDRYYDARIGFPISHGCLRMYNDDIWYLYNNIPSGTTVVVY